MTSGLSKISTNELEELKLRKMRVAEIQKIVLAFIILCFAQLKVHKIRRTFLGNKVNEFFFQFGIGIVIVTRMRDPEKKNNERTSLAKLSIARAAGILQFPTIPHK
jgi:undecaprenyl pyrophosphate phosphatase UppP